MHDGLLMEVKIGEELSALAVVKRIMERPLDYSTCSLSRDVKLVVPAEVSVGENWMHLKEIKL